MSMLLMVKAMELKVGNPLRKLVLIKLADNANDKGECFPSISYIADQCEISERSVQNHIKQLSEDGLVTIQNRKTKTGLNRSNIYRLNFSGANDSSSGANDSNSGANDSNSGEFSSPLNGANDAPRTSNSLEPVIEPLIESRASKKYKSKKASQLPDDFQPNEHHREIAYSEHVNLENEFIKFKDYCLANGKKYVDWGAGFNNWLRNAGKYAREKSKGGSGYKSLADRNREILESMRG